MALCLVLGACAGTDVGSTTDAGPEEVAQTQHNLSRTPFAIVPASAETVQETGVEKWTMHHIDPNTTLVAGWNNHALRTFVRVRIAADHTLHLDYGKNAGVVVFDANGQVASGFAGPEFGRRTQEIAHFGRDIAANKNAPYDCTYAVLAGIGGLIVATGSCAPLMATGPLAPGAVAVCLGGQLVNFAGGYQIGIECGDHIKQWFNVEEDHSVVEECEGDACGEGYPDVFEDDGAEGHGGDDEGGAGTSGGGDGDPGEGDSGGDDSGGGDDGPPPQPGGGFPGGGLGET